MLWRWRLSAAQYPMLVCMPFQHLLGFVLCCVCCVILLLPVIGLVKSARSPPPRSMSLPGKGATYSLVWLLGVPCHHTLMVLGAACVGEPA